MPLQPGNSGGAVLNVKGNGVGVVLAKLSQQAAVAASGLTAENVNYAVKRSFLLGLPESLPQVAAKLPEPDSGQWAFEEVVKRAERAAVFVLVYRGESVRHPYCVPATAWRVGRPRFCPFGGSR